MFDYDIVKDWGADQKMSFVCYCYGKMCVFSGYKNRPDEKQVPNMESFQSCWLTGISNLELLHSISCHVHVCINSVKSQTCPY